MKRTALALVVALALACAVVVIALGPSPARAADATPALLVLRVANQGDIQSMDPHSLLEALQLGFMGNVYEPLVGRDKANGLAPALATKWTQTSPTVWRFELRQGVRFHDGTPFSADDVVFSLNRAAG